MKNNNPYISPETTVVVMGCGVTGSAAVDYALSCGAKVLVSDSRDETAFAETAAMLKEKGVEWECGHTLNFLLRGGIVLLSPGIAPDNPLVLLLRERGVKVMGELAVLAPVLSGVKVVAVTGSNGKTTVTSLIGEVLEKLGRSVFVGGNIGVSLYEYCAGSVDPCEVVVVEVSSFQLEVAGEFAPDVAVLLNITPDHLDRHHGLQGYIAAKLNILRAQSAEQVAVINGEDASCQNLSKDFRAEIQSFGYGPDNQAIVEEGQLLLVEEEERKVLWLPAGSTGFSSENFAAAALALRALGVEVETLEKYFAEFKRPPHRMELVAEVDGVAWVNDSKATNTGAVIGALRQFDHPVVLIAGGRDKGEDYHQLCEVVKQRVKAAILIGESADDIEQALVSCTEVHRAASLEEAVSIGRELAITGETVLLSPACSSFDMYKSYGHRGEVFRAAVHALEAK
ncbi:MAG: UDP-N-acetylmuramoyl-L-alanine--D-glutamate ligase [Desulforhopalus sp.]|nr:UDP-N-acetylmuramoyl-L-alanine--D-glutamate ligase [Desulforhopalus sp.]